MNQIIISVVLFLIAILFANTKINRLNEELMNKKNPLPTIGTSENSNNDVLVDKLNKLEQESKKIKEELNKFKNRGGSSGDGDIINTFNITGGHTTQSLNELGYEITSNNEIIFNKKVKFNNEAEFKKHANFRDLVDFYHHTKMHYNKHHNLLPRGTIILNYAINNIPYGWALCDGKSYKLNSSGKAVVSTDSDAIKTPNLTQTYVKGCTDCVRTGGWANHEFRVWGSEEPREIRISKENLPEHSHVYAHYSWSKQKKTEVDKADKGNDTEVYANRPPAEFPDTTGNDRNGNLRGWPISIPEPKHLRLAYIMKL